MTIEILTLVGIFILKKSAVENEKKLHKSVGIIIIDATLILPFVKISHQKVNLPQKFTVP
jgi:hypothetical protein